MSVKLTCKCSHEHPHREAPGLCLYCFSDAVKALKKAEAENRELAASLAVLMDALNRFAIRPCPCGREGCTAAGTYSTAKELLSDLPAAAKALQDRLAQAKRERDDWKAATEDACRQWELNVADLRGKIAQAEAKVKRLVVENERLNRMINQQGHIVEFRETSFGLEHPMECRSTLDGRSKSLIDCLVNRALEALTDPPKLGRYRVELKHYGIELAEIEPLASRNAEED